MAGFEPKPRLATYDNVKVSRWPVSGEELFMNVNGTNVLLSRDKFLDHFGNPVYRAAKVNSDGRIGKSYCTNGNPVGVVCKALNHND